MGSMLGSNEKKHPHLLSFQDMQYILSRPENFTIINTLPIYDQLCILPNTISAEIEVETINNLIKNAQLNRFIVIYGKNCNDDSVWQKQAQLQSLGFGQVFIYLGGMFEWLLLQDFYSESAMFPTTSTNIKENNILHFLPPKHFRSATAAASTEITFI